MPGSPVVTAPPARPRTQARPRGHAIWLLAALALIVVLGGCQLDPDAVKKDPFLQELVAAQQQSATPKLGEAFEVGNTRWTIASTEAAYRIKLGADQFQAHGVYVVVHFTFTSLMDTPQHAPSDILMLQSGGNTFTADGATTAAFTGWTHATNLLAATLQPNAAYTAALVFDVPRDAGGLTVQVHSLPDPNQAPFAI